MIQAAWPDSQVLPIEVPLIEHAEDPALAAGSVMRAGATATRLGLTGWPASAELSIVERDIALAHETGGWVHFTHLSTSGGLDAIRRAGNRGAAALGVSVSQEPLVSVVPIEGLERRGGFDGRFSGQRRLGHGRWSWFRRRRMSGRCRSPR